MFFILSKIFWFVVQPDNLLLGLLLLSALLCLAGRRRPRLLGLGRVLLAVTAVASLAIATLPFGLWMILPLENRFAVPAELPARVDGIVVAGGILDQYVSASRGQVALNGSADRAFAFADLAQRYPDAKLVYSAGSGSLGRQALKEADFVLPVLSRLGIAPERVILENRSRNTYENAVFSKEVGGYTPGQTWVLVTSAFHMPRAVGCFRAAGWKVIPYPTDYELESTPPSGFRFSFRRGLSTLSGGLHEWLGLIFYRLSGRTDAFFPAPTP